MTRRVAPFQGSCCDPELETVCPCGAVVCASHDDHDCEAA